MRYAGLSALMGGILKPCLEPMRSYIHVMAEIEDGSSSWSLALASVRRPYPLSLPTVVPMAALMLLVPVYIVIAEAMQGRTLHAPELAVDRVIPLLPGWAIVYGALYLFLILVPFFVVRQEQQVRRALFAYLTVWSTAFAVFLLYPTAAPRPDAVAGSGFAAWGLRFLYGADPPLNCFPSLHVAHSFVSASACARVHRGLGMVATAGAALVAVSTLFTKQHYVLDVIAGIVLARIACAIFLRHDDTAPTRDRRAAPALAVGIACALALATFAAWTVYRLSGKA